MVNRPKAKGTSAESAIVKYAQANGFAGAMRPALAGTYDIGDVWLEPGPTIIIESKIVAGAPAMGQPPKAMFDAWWGQTCTEAHNARANVGLLVVKRKGTTNPGRWWCWMPGTLIVRAAGCDRPAWDVPGLIETPVGTTLSHALLLARMAGYGDELSALDLA